MIKKFIFGITIFFMAIAIALPAISSNNVSDPTLTNKPAKVENSANQPLMLRLNEIKGMDKSELTRLEKKNLRKEVKDIKKEMSVNNGGIYLSVGAIIIVILLLILLL